MSHKGPANPERSFGISVGSVLLLVAAALIWKDRIRTAEIVGAIGAILLLLGLTQPRLLKYPSAVWWKFALTLGWINARVILTIAFALLLTPMGLLWRLIGKDPLTRRRSNWPGWDSYPARYQDRDHFTRMY